VDAPRKAYAIVEYDGEDITDAVSAGLLSLTFTDNSDECDELIITVEDIDGNWQGPWYPKIAAKRGDDAADDADLEYDYEDEYDPAPS